MASKSFSEKSFKDSESLKLPSVVLNKELHALIGTVKEVDLITTYEEVLEGLRKYIVDKKLYDENNPCKVLCKDDELGCVLGIEEFIVSDMKNLLQKIVVPLNKAYRDSADAVSLSSDNPLKRKNDELESSESGQRKLLAVDVGVHTSPLILHIPPSPSYFDMSDSVESLQGYETAFVKDTSDDFLSAENGEERIFAIEETYNIEYEVETDSNDSSCSEDCSDSESDVSIDPVVFLNAAILTYKQESDIEFFADDSSDNDDGEFDLEISESDSWKCKTCNISNKPPMRYCLKCFEERVNWMPDKPTRMKRKPKKSLSVSDKYINEASVSKYDQDSQGSCSSGGCSEIKENTSDPSSDLLSANDEFYHFSTDVVDLSSTSLHCPESTASPSLKSVSSLSVKSTDTYCMESVNSQCIEPTDLTSVKPNDLPADNTLKDNNLDDLRSAEAFCMKSISLPCIESSGLSSMESSCGPSSMEPTSSPYSMEPTSSPYSMEPTSGLSSMESTSGLSSVESSDPSNIGLTCSTSAEPSCSSVESIPKLCLICCTNPANASIIHGKYAHQISCYKCARKLQKQKKCCPVCRRTIDRVVHQINI